MLRRYLAFNLAKKYRKDMAHKILNQREINLSDFTIVCGKVAFPVHKVLLVIVSGYFFSLFCKTSSKIPFNRLGFPDCDPKAMTVLIQFIYSGKITKCLYENLDVKVRSQIAKFAETLQINTMEHRCEIFKSCINSYLQLWDVAIETKEKMMEKIIENYVIRNIKSCVKDENFAFLSMKQLMKILSNRHFHNCSDMIKCEVISKWINGDIISRSNYAYSLTIIARLSANARQYALSSLEHNFDYTLSVQNQEEDGQQTKYFRLIVPRKAGYHVTPVWKKISMKFRKQKKTKDNDIFKCCNKKMKPKRSSINVEVESLNVSPTFKWTLDTNECTSDTESIDNDLPSFTPKTEEFTILDMKCSEEEVLPSSSSSFTLPKLSSTDLITR